MADKATEETEMIKLPKSNDLTIVSNPVSGVSVKTDSPVNTKKALLMEDNNTGYAPVGESTFSYFDPNTWSEAQVDMLLSKLGYVFFGVMLFVLLTFMLGFDFMLPNGPGWSVFLIWIVSFVSAKVMGYHELPGLLGSLVSGIILKNLPGDPVQGLPDSWATTLRALGLSLILMRSGLELDIPALKKQGWVAARLTVMPGVAEAFTVAGANMLIFGMPFALALSGGFILAAVSPAVVVSGMFYLQANGYGVDKGVPSLVVAAASFDDVVAISGFSMCIGLAIAGGEDPILGAIEGPINVIAGATLGYCGGHIVGCSRIFNSDFKRTVAMVFVGLSYMFIASSIHFTGAGALAGLVTGLFASISWQSGNMGWLSNGPLAHTHHEVEHAVANLWELFAQPVLFGIIGASIDFRVVDAATIPAAVAVVVIGSCIRVPVAFFATGGKDDLNFWERAFIGLTWIPKATVQAALGSVPLTLVEEVMDHDDPDFDKYEKWGNDILVTAVFSILITAPIGLVVISELGPRWLVKKEDELDEIEVDLDEDSENDGGKKATIKVVRTLETDKQDDWFNFEAQRRDRQALKDNSEDDAEAENRVKLGRFFTQLNDHMNKANQFLRVIESEAAAGSIGSSPHKSTKDKSGGFMNEKDQKERHENIKSTAQKIREELIATYEGVQVTWEVIEREKKFPAGELFSSPNGFYINKPTQEEVLSAVTVRRSQSSQALSQATPVALLPAKEYKVERKPSFVVLAPASYHT